MLVMEVRGRELRGWCGGGLTWSPDRIAQRVGEVFVIHFGTEWDTNRRGYQSSSGARHENLRGTTIA